MSPHFYHNLGTLPFAGMEEDRALRRGGSGRHTTTMRVPLKIKSAPAKLTGQEPPGRHPNDRQRNRLLPIHEAKIAPNRSDATDEIRSAVAFLVANSAKSGESPVSLTHARRRKSRRNRIMYLRSCRYTLPGSANGSGASFRQPVIFPCRCFGRTAPLQVERGLPRRSRAFDTN